MSESRLELATQVCLIKLTEYSLRRFSSVSCPRHPGPRKHAFSLWSQPSEKASTRDTKTVTSSLGSKKCLKLVLGQRVICGALVWVQFDLLFLWLLQSILLEMLYIFNYFNCFCICKPPRVPGNGQL